MKKKLLSLFSGCGGMDIGFEGGFKVPKQIINNKSHSYIDKENKKDIVLKKTFFKTMFANDINCYAKLAWEDYFSKSRTESIEEIYKVGSIVDIVKEYKKGNKDVFPQDIDIVTGGFPCQDFSVAGRRKGLKSHKDHNGNIILENIPNEETRGQLYIWMKNVIEITLPKIFIAENVKGLSNLGKVKEIIQKDFSKINGDGYLVLPPQILHAGNYGIPQSRERMFFIVIQKSELTKQALKELTEVEIKDQYSPYPMPTHDLNTDFVKCKTVLSDLKEPKDATDLSQINYSKAKFMGKHCQGQKEINLDKLAPTIRAEHHGNIEYRRLSIEHGGKYLKELKKDKDERRLTLRECARIQTFPDNFNFVIPEQKGKKRFSLSPSQGYRLVGNAVPPILAYHIAKKIEKNWDFYFDNKKEAKNA